MYMGAVVKINGGPTFAHPPPEEDVLPLSAAVAAPAPPSAPVSAAPSAPSSQTPAPADTPTA